MKRYPLVVFMAALISAVGAIFTAPVLQAVQSATPALAGDRPKNLKVLSKDLTVPQVREVMDTWTDELGADCSTCHVRDPKDLAPNGRPRFNYADDSKQEKATARVMYAMTEEINSRFISTVPNSGMPVTCGTCHRGHLSPEPFAAANNNSAPDKESMRIRNKVASPQ